MRKIIVGAAVLAIVATPLGAQGIDAGGGTLGSVSVQPYVGYMKFGELADLGGEREFSNEDGPFYGLQAGWHITPYFGLIGNVGYTKSKFVVKDPGGVDGSSYYNASGDIGTFFYDANVQARLPVAALGSGVSPFLQAGVGQVKYTADTDDIAADGTTSTAFNVGLGTDVRLGRALGLRLMVKDYITSLDWDDVADVPDELRDGRDNNVANNFAFTVGLNLGF